MPFVGSVRGSYGPQDRSLREKGSDIQTDDLDRVRQQYGGISDGGIISASGGYVYHLFETDNLTVTKTDTFTANSDKTVEYLIVGGGGSGGSYPYDNPNVAAGSDRRGGSGGQVKTGNTSINKNNYTISIGGGGPGWTDENNGSPSSAFGITSNGGAKTTHNGTGANGTYVASFSEFGDNGYFGAQGGGGNANGYGYAGGLGGGGQGARFILSNPNAQSGSPSTGGGGGGTNGFNASGSGGSGVVIVRYQL